MANGFVGERARLVKDVTTAIYTVPADTGATVNINVANHGPDIAMVKVAITSGGAPAHGDWIETGESLASGQTLLRTNEPLKAGEKVYAEASASGVDVRVSGYQEDV